MSRLTQTAARISLGMLLTILLGATAAMVLFTELSTHAPELQAVGSEPSGTTDTPHAT